MRSGRELREKKAKMEYYCLGARNFAAMAVSPFPTGRTRRKALRVRTKQSAVDCNHSSYKVTARATSSNAGSESCVAVKEEDYIKAGGSQLVFVQMQQNKSMDKQSKLADKVCILSLSFIYIYINILV